MGRYVYDHATTGSRHDGGLGSSDDLAEAIREAARIDGLGTDCYASVYDRQTGRHITWTSRDDNGPMTTRRVRSALALMAGSDGWALPAHRPRRDPSAARVVRSYRLHPGTIARVDAEAKRTGESAGQVIDRLAAGLGH